MGGIAMETTDTLAGKLREQIDIENTATPAEAMSFIQAHRHHSGLTPFLNKLEKMIVNASDDIREYRKVALYGNAYIYHSSNKNAHLMICFCGRALRLLCPIPVFLQYIPPNACDVLILKDSGLLDFHQGVPGFGDNLTSSLQLLKDLIQRRRYSQVTTFGTSGGGCAALYCGVHLGAGKAIAIGGRHPSTYTETLAKLIKHGLTGEEFSQLLATQSLPVTTRAYAFFSEGHDADRKSASRFLSDLPFLQQVSISGTDNHNCLEVLRSRGELHQLFSMITASS